MADICFRCHKEDNDHPYCDDIGNPLCAYCVDDWDLSGRPAGWFLSKPLPNALMVIHWDRCRWEEEWGVVQFSPPILLGYPGYRGTADEKVEACDVDTEWELYDYTIPDCYKRLEV